MSDSTELSLPIISPRELERSKKIRNYIEHGWFIEDLETLVADFVRTISVQFSNVENFGDINVVEAACKPKKFSNQHQHHELDGLMARIIDETSEYNNHTLIQSYVLEIEKLLNRGFTEDSPIVVGYRIEHTGISNNYEPKIVVPSGGRPDLILHTNPVDGGSILAQAVSHMNDTRRTHIIQTPFQPPVAATATLYELHSPLHSLASAEFHFGKKIIVSSGKAGNHYVTHTTLLDSRTDDPTPELKYNRRLSSHKISMFLANYHSQFGEVYGIAEDMLLHRLSQKNLELLIERGPIASSANIEGAMVIDGGTHHLYLDFRYELSRAFEEYRTKELARGTVVERPTRSRHAVQKWSNVAAVISNVRGSNLEACFILPKDSVPSSKVLEESENFVIVKDIDAIDEYFKQYNTANPGVNPELSLMFGFPELFDKDTKNPYYIVPEIVRTIEEARKKFVDVAKEKAQIEYILPPVFLEKHLGRGSRKLVYEGLLNHEWYEFEKDKLVHATEMLGETYLIAKILKPVVDQEERLRLLGENHVIRTEREGLINIVLDFLNKKRDLPIAQVYHFGHTGLDLGKTSATGEHDKVSYLICKPYDTTLDDLCPLGTRPEISLILDVGDSITRVLSELHSEHLGVVHMDLKASNIGVENNIDATGKKIEGSYKRFIIDDVEDFVWIDTSDKKDGRPSLIYSWHTGSIETRCPELHALYSNEVKAQLIKKAEQEYKDNPTELNAIVSGLRSDIISVKSSSTFDIFAAGCVLYRLVTGESPFCPPEKKPSKGDPDRDIYDYNTMKNATNPDHYQIVFDRMKNKFVPSDLIDVIEKSMQFNPEKRYQTGAEMNTDFQKVQAYDKLYNSIKSNLANYYPAWEGQNTIPGKVDTEKLDHVLEVERNLLLLCPHASYSERIAALLHDYVPRSGPMVKDKSSGPAYRRDKRREADRTADNIAEVFKTELQLQDNQSIDPLYTPLIEYVTEMIRYHDHEKITDVREEFLLKNTRTINTAKNVQSDYRLYSSIQLLMDADSLGFFHSTLSSYEKIEGNNVPDKVRFMYDKMSPVGFNLLIKRDEYEKIHSLYYILPTGQDGLAALQTSQTGTASL